MSGSPSSRYRLVGTRRDGTSATVLGRMTLAEAMKARDAIETAGIFASVRVVTDFTVPPVKPLAPPGDPDG